MKIYVAARYGRMEELRSFVSQLESLGHECTSRWIAGGEHEKTQRGAAEMDVEDVLRADALIFVGQPSGSENRGGGRWFEFGVAWQAGKQCFAVLDRSSAGEHFGSKEGHESVFTHLPTVSISYSLDEILEILA